MAAEGARRVKQEGSDSDDSMSGRRPEFSSEEETLPDDLLKNSKEFIRLYEKHQPELQQVINDLRKISDKFLDKFGSATRVSMAGGAVGAAGVGAALLLAPFTFGISLVVGVGAAAGGAATGVIGNIMKGNGQEKAVEEVENALKKFNTTIDRVTNHLKKICNDIEKILQFKDDEQSFSIKRGIKHLGLLAVLCALDKLFTTEVLQRLFQQIQRTVHMQLIMESFISVLLSILPFVNILEDNRTLRDIDKLKRRSSVREWELESKAGKFICKMRETNEQLQNTLNELKTSKSEIERVIIPNLNQYVKQQRGTHKSAESD